MMDAKLSMLAAKFLDDHSRKLGNEGCNDWEFPDDWTIQERRDFVSGSCAANGTPEEYDPENLVIPDFSAVDYLAHLLKSEADR